MLKKMPNPHHPLDTLRCCAICRHHKPRRQMLRFYRTKGSDEGWQLDLHHLAKVQRHPAPPQPQGRGIWLCRDTSCHHPKKLGRGFRREATKIAEILKSTAF